MLHVNGVHSDVNISNIAKRCDRCQHAFSVKASPMSTRATYHHGDLRRALLDTALQLIAEYGPNGFSLREAARAIGVSPAAVYRHFADKPALITALAVEGHARLATAMEEAAARAQGPDARARSVAALGAIGRAYIDFAVKHPSFFRVMFGASGHAEESPLSCVASDRYGYEILTESLDELVATGAIPSERRPSAAICAWSLVHGFSTLVIEGALTFGSRKLDEAYQALLRNLLLAIGCDLALVPAAAPLRDDAFFPTPSTKAPSGRKTRHATEHAGSPRSQIREKKGASPSSAAALKQRKAIVRP